jgi:hypothetical protein
MSCDKLVFDLSQEIEGSPNVFVKKDFLNILDNQNQNYNSNQSVIDTSQLSNSNKYMSYREAYLAMPLLLTVASANATASIVAADFAPATPATSADYAIGLKSWFGQMIHSFTLDYNGTTIIQQTPYINMWNSFKLITSMSMADVITQGSSIGFYPDDPLAWSFQTAASVNGMGVCNNTNIITSGQVNAVQGADNKYKSGAGNIGFLTRQMYVNYDVDGIPISSTYGALLSAQSAQNLWKSYVSKKQNATLGALQGIFQISILATVHLKHIHSFFQMCPLLKGVFMKMTMNLNNTSTSFSRSATTNLLSLVSVSNAVGGVNPVMIASTFAGNGGVSAWGGTLGTATAFTANVSVGAVVLDQSLASLTGIGVGGLAKSIYLYVPAYTFNPVFEQSYLSSPIKQIKYSDVYQYQVAGIAGGGQFNNLLTNGIANIKSVLLLPFYSPSSAQFAANTGLPNGIPVYQSPFDPAGTGCTSPLALLTNFNVVVSGQNAIYNTQRYNFEQFNNQLYGVNAVNGGMTDGLTSALINSLGFEMEYCYYYVDVSRMLPVEEAVPKSIQIVGTNSCAKALDLWCFVEYGVEVSIDILTGARV